MTTDRDRSIEQLLRRTAPLEPHAERDCPDAETLAALADDTLTAAARREVEGHIADCHRCQAMTAAMVRAEMPAGPPADAAEGAIPAWRRRAFNWLVPAAAAATAIALWILIPGQQTPLPEQPQADTQVAASPPAAAQSEVIIEEPLRIPGESLADRAARERDANVAQERAAPNPPAASAPAPPAPAATAAPAVSKSAGAAGGRLASRDASAERGQAAETTAPSGANQAARQESGSLEERVAVAPPPPNEVTAASPITIAPQEQRRADAAPPAAPAALGASAAQLRAAIDFEVVSPDPRIRWRVVPGPVVQSSTDGGTTWTTQQTGATAQLTAGSAPTPTVSWLVGRGGLVLRTTDGGRRWERVAFPQAIDLTAVTASNALNATVTLADGRRLATTDGGKTWVPARN